MATPGLFELRSAGDLYKKALRETADFHRQPSDERLFNLICTLTHLREWIYSAGYETIKDLPRDCLSREQAFFADLYDDPDFRIVRALCNNAKHFDDATGINSSARTFTGFFAGFNFAGDSLDQRNYVVSGQNLRAIIGRLVVRYRRYFEGSQSP